MTSIISSKPRVAISLALVAVLAIAAALAFLPSGTAYAIHITPDQFDDNPTCGDFAAGEGTVEIKIDSNKVAGTYTGPDLNGDGNPETITITASAEGGGENVLMSWTSTFGIDAVFVKGGSQGGNLYLYDPEETSDTDLTTPTIQAISHVSFCFDFDLNVSKTADPTFTRTHDWSIAKSVDQLAPFVGENINYTIDVSYDGAIDSAWAVSGQVDISNPSPLTVTISSPIDEISGLGAVTLNCGAVSFPFDLAPGATLSCTYATTLPDGSARTNTASVDVVSSSGSLGAGFVETDPGNDGTAPVATTIVGDSPVGGNTGSADFSFVTPTTVVDETVTASDPTLVLSQNFTAPTGGSFGKATSYATTGAKTNTACVAEDSTGEPGDPTENCATVIVHVFDISVSKTESTSLTRTHDWSIAKSVDEDEPFFGETVNYTIDVSYDGFTDSAHNVSGTITVTNNHPTRDVIGALLNDALVDIVDQSVNVAANSSTDVNYSKDLPGNDTTNTATATLFSVDYDSNTVDVEFGNNADTINQVDETVTASDLSLGLSQNFTAPTGGSFGDSTSFGTTGPHSNTACVAETSVDAADGDPAENCATVTVTAYGLTVSKDADTDFTRDYDWTITKTSNAEAIDAGDGSLDGDIDIGQNQTLIVIYTIEVTGTFADSAHTVSGTITITNNHPTRDVTVDIADSLSTGGGNQNFADVPVGAAQTIQVGYSIADLQGADGTSGDNDVTVDITDVDDVAVTYGASADYSYTGPTTQIDQFATVDDDYDSDLGAQFLANFGVQVLDGSVTLEETYNYAVTFDTSQCGVSTVPNVASVVFTNGSVSAAHSVIVEVHCDDGPLTRTQGYWKTHSFHGPAPFDDTWDLVDPDGQDSLFFDTGLTWFELFWLPNGGNPYIGLAHQYMAAVLNQHAGADTSVLLDLTAVDPEDGEVLDFNNVLAEAAALLDSRENLITAGDPDLYKGKARKSLHDMLRLACVLDDYNNGVIGPGSADEIDPDGSDCEYTYPDL